MPTIQSPRVLILATSLNQNSRSRVLAEYARIAVRDRFPAIAVELLDLQTLERLPMAGTPDAYGPHEGVDRLRTAVRAATHLLIALPIYNYSGSATAKNVIELLGNEDIGGKTVGFLCSAAGQRAYMSVLGLANALMLDFRCWIVPRFVYATGSDFTDGDQCSTEVGERVESLVDELLSHGPVTW